MNQTQLREARNLTITDHFASDTDGRYAFGPHLDPLANILHRIHVIFEDSNRCLWSSATDLIAPNMECAQDFVDELNVRLGFDVETWMAFVARFFRGASEARRIPQIQTTPVP